MNRPLIWLSATSLLLLGAFGAWRFEHSAPEVTSEPPALAAPRVVPKASAAPVPEILRRRPASAAGPNGGAVADASYTTALQMFREFSKYPPNSRPVDESHQDVAQPYIVATGTQELVRPADALGRTTGSGVLCVLQPEQHTVVEGAWQRVTLVCRRGAEGPENTAPPLSLVIGGVTLRGQVEGSNEQVVSGSDFGDLGSKGDERAGDGVYTLAFQPKLGPGAVHLSAMVAIADREAGDPLDAQPLVASFSVAAAAPARFTGKVSERLADGSLYVDVEIDVAKAGRYRIFANLEGDGGLLAYAKEDRDLPTGRQTVPLLFFGKILRDAGVQGPLVVTNLRGLRFDFERDPGGMTHQPLQPIARAYETARYQPSDFSPDEWESEYKRERLVELEALAAAE